jgi:hypothetical protein
MAPVVWPLKVIVNVPAVTVPVVERVWTSLVPLVSTVMS